MADNRNDLRDIPDEYDLSMSPSMVLNLDEILESIEQEKHGFIGDRGTDFDPALEEKRMDLIRREIISGDYEHKYLGEEYKDVIAEEKRVREERAMAESSPLQLSEDNTDSSGSNLFDELMKDDSIGRDPLAGNAVLNFDADSIINNVQSEDEMNEHENAEPIIEEEAVIKESKTASRQPEEAVESFLPEKKKKKFSLFGFGKRKAEDEEDEEFVRKFQKISEKNISVSDDSELEQTFTDDLGIVDDVETGRSFSEKMEEDDLYESDGNNENSEHKHLGLVSDKTGLFSFAKTDSEEEEHKHDDPLNDITNDEMTKIIMDYEKSKSRTVERADVSENKGALAVVDKILGSVHVDNDETKLIGTDLSDGMKNLKRERLNKTTNIPPIERQTISDIDLDLGDKIIPNTVPIPDEESRVEIEKLRTLRETRDEKIKSFNFISEDDEDDEETEQIQVIEDYESMDDAPAISADIENVRASMTWRLIILCVCFVFTFFLSLSNEMRVTVPEILSMRSSPFAYIFVNFIFGMVAAIVSSSVLASGFSKLVRMKADSDSLSAIPITFSLILSLISFADTNLVRDGIVHSYVSVGIGVLIFNTVGKLLIIDRTQRNFKFVSGDCEHYALFTMNSEDGAETFIKSTPGSDYPILSAMKKTDILSDFMKKSYSSDSSDRFCRLFTPIILIAGLLIALIAIAVESGQYGSHSVFVGLSSYVTLIAMCSCYSMMLVVNLPMHKASKKYSELQGAMIGFDGIDEYSDVNTLMVDASQIFPSGSVCLYGIKIFSDTRVDEAIVEAASLTTHSSSIMKSMFYEIIGGKTEMLYPVESYIYEDSTGLCGWINNKRILLGSRKLMTNHSIEGMPSEKKEAEYTGGKRIPVYLSISGELSAMFIIDIAPMPEVYNAFRELRRNDMKVVIRTVDSAITAEKMSEMFDVSPTMFKIMPFATHNEYMRVTSYKPKQSASLACSGRFAAMANLVTGARKLRGTISVGIALQAVSVLLGILITLTMVVLQLFTGMTVGLVVLYNVIFIILVMLLNLIRKV